MSDYVYLCVSTSTSNLHNKPKKSNLVPTSNRHGERMSKKKVMSCCGKNEQTNKAQPMICRAMATRRRKVQGKARAGVRTLGGSWRLCGKEEEKETKSCPTHPSIHKRASSEILGCTICPCTLHGAVNWSKRRRTANTHMDNTCLAFILGQRSFLSSLSSFG